MTATSVFSRAAAWTSRQCGRPAIFLLAAGVIVLWAATGPYFSYSDTWQLIINTGTTVITFLMVFLIQNTQNRDAAAVQLKLDELIRANENARNALVRLEDLEDEEIGRMRETFDPVIRKGPDR
jgi:low affinity Fe/Cu permease